jgi:hypothetical protein
MSSPWQPARIVTNILIPLAEALERFARHGVTSRVWDLLSSSPVRLIDHKTRDTYIRVLTEYFAYKKNPDYAQHFEAQLNEAVRRYDSTVGTLSSLPRLNESPTDEQREAFQKWLTQYDQLTHSLNYREAIETAAHTAEYLRQLASMMSDEQELEPAKSSRKRKPSKDTKRTKAEPKNKQARLELAESRKQFRIDSQWYDYTGDNASYLLAVLLKAAGTWLSGSELVSDRRSRPDKVIGRLPLPIRKIIKSLPGGTGGYRINPEYFR